MWEKKPRCLPRNKKTTACYKKLSCSLLILYLNEKLPINAVAGFLCVERSKIIPHWNIWLLIDFTFLLIEAWLVTRWGNNPSHLKLVVIGTEMNEICFRCIRNCSTVPTNITADFAVSICPLQPHSHLSIQPSTNQEIKTLFLSASICHSKCMILKAFLSVQDLIRARWVSHHGPREDSFLCTLRFSQTHRHTHSWKPGKPHMHALNT